MQLVMAALLAALLWLAAPSVPAVERVPGEGRALVLDGDEAQARQEALAKALEDAALRAGATVQASSLLDTSGALHEQTLVRANHHVLGYEVLEERVEDAVVTTRIAAVVAAPENRACGAAALGGRIEVDAASHYLGLPGEARAIRAVSAYQDGFGEQVVAALNAAPWPAALEFAVVAPQGYERLTRRATSAAPLRGQLKIVATIRAAPAAGTGQAGMHYVSYMQAEFLDALSGARTALGDYQQALPDSAPRGAATSLGADTMKTLKNVSHAVLRKARGEVPSPVAPGGLPALARTLATLICTPVSLPLQRAGAALSVAVGAAHGVDAGTLFRAETSGGAVFLRAAQVAQGSAQLSVIGRDALPMEVSQVELLGHAQ